MPQARTLISKLKTIFIFFSFIAMATLLSLSVQPLLQDVTSIHIACILKIRCGYGAKEEQLPTVFEPAKSIIFSISVGPSASDFLLPISP